MLYLSIFVYGSNESAGSINSYGDGRVSRSTNVYELSLSIGSIFFINGGGAESYTK